MRAMVIDRFGGPDVLHIAEIEQPEPGPGQVLIRLSHAGVNPADWKAREGWLSLYFAYRFPFVLGFDGAGRIEAIGPGVDGLAPGDRVVTACNQGKGERGTYAQFVVADVERVVRLPDTVSFERAASLPTAGMTAIEALVDVGHVVAGQHVLVNGGAGGTGSFAICIAVALGAHVAATARKANHDYLRSLGVECPIDYQADDIGDAVRAWSPDGVELVIDTYGQGSLLDAVDWVRPGGIIAPIATLIADEPQHDPLRAASRGVQIVPTLSTFPNQPRQLRDLVAMAGDGRFDTIALTVAPLDQAADAHRKIEAGHVRGKIVLKIDDGLA